MVRTSGTDFSLQIHENRASPCINPPSPQQSRSKRDADKKAEGKRPKKREKEAAEKMGHKQPKKETNAQRRDSWAGPLCGLRPPSLLRWTAVLKTRGANMPKSSSWLKVILWPYSQGHQKSPSTSHTPLGRASCGLMDSCLPPKGEVQGPSPCSSIQ